MLLAFLGVSPDKPGSVHRDASSSRPREWRYLSHLPSVVDPCRLSYDVSYPDVSILDMNSVAVALLQ